MTDDTGLLEHSLGRIPRRREGYSTDDNARAIWACLEWLALCEDKGEKERLHRLLDRYLAFLLWAQNDDGTFHNNVFLRPDKGRGNAVRRLLRPVVLGVGHRVRPSQRSGAA